MNITTQLNFRDDEFSGMGRLFPLPNLVLFPHVVQALHIFEPRYRILLEDALADDSLIVMATCLADPPAECCCRAPIAPAACLARIVSTRTQADGRSDILVLGVRRVNILSELPLIRPYREAELELLLEPIGEHDADSAYSRRQLLEELVAITDKLFSGEACSSHSLEKIIEGRHSLGMITDLLSYSLPLERDTKLALLAEVDSFKRALLLLESLATELQGCRSAVNELFPPQFSWN